MVNHLLHSCSTVLWHAKIRYEKFAAMGSMMMIRNHVFSLWQTDKIQKSIIIYYYGTSHFFFRSDKYKTHNESLRQQQFIHMHKKRLRTTAKFGSPHLSDAKFHVLIFCQTRQQIANNNKIVIMMCDAVIRAAHSPAICSAWDNHILFNFHRRLLKFMAQKMPSKWAINIMITSFVI